MVTKYGVYNPSTGLITQYDTKEDALQAFWQNVIGIAKNYWHDCAYTIIQIDENGVETWFTDDNQEISKPRTAEEIEAMMTKVQTLP